MDPGLEDDFSPLQSGTAPAQPAEGNSSENSDAQAQGLRGTQDISSVFTRSTIELQSQFTRKLGP